MVFRSPHGAQWERYLAPTISDGSVYINGGAYGGMYSFDAFTGQQNWFNSSLPQYDEWTPAVDETHAYAYVGEYSPGLYAVDRNTGALDYQISDPNFDWSGWSMDTAPVIGNNRNVLAIHGGRMVSFDLDNQAIAWELDRSFIGTPVLTESGTLYGIDAGVLSAFDEITGEPLWNWEVPSENLTGNFLVTDNMAFVQSQTSTYALDLATLESVWSIDAVGQLTWSDNRLFIAGQDGVLTSVTAQSVPEPSSAFLLGMLALFGLRRHRTIHCGSVRWNESMRS